MRCDGKGKPSFPGKGEKRGREISNGRPSNEAFFLSIRYNRKPPTSSHVSTSTVSSQISSDTCDGRFFQVREEEWKKEEEKCSPSSSSPYRIEKKFLLFKFSFRSTITEGIEESIMEYTWYIQNEHKNSLGERKKKKRKYVRTEHGLIPGWHKSRNPWPRICETRRRHTNVSP